MSPHPPQPIAFLGALRSAHGLCPFASRFSLTSFVPNRALRAPAILIPRALSTCAANASQVSARPPHRRSSDGLLAIYISKRITKLFIRRLVLHQHPFNTPVSGRHPSPRASRRVPRRRSGSSRRRLRERVPGPPRSHRSLRAGRVPARVARRDRRRIP